MADCYSAYQGIELRTGGQIERGACVTHARRKVFAAREAYPLESSVVLAKFQELYYIETPAAGSGRRFLTTFLNSSVSGLLGAPSLGSQSTKSEYAAD